MRRIRGECVLIVVLPLLLGALLFICVGPASGKPPDPREDHASGQEENPLAIARPSALAPATVTMVLVPSGDVPSVTEAAEDVADLLAAETGHNVEILVSDCDGAAVGAMAVGEADVGWLPSPTYVLANARIGAEAKLVGRRYGSTQFRGQFLVRTDSGIDDLADLAGQNFAFGDPSSSSSFLYPAVHISHTQGVTYAVFFSQTVFAGSHDAVARAVYEGNYEGTPIHGGATYEDVRWAMLDEFPDIFTETKVITYAPWIPNDAFSVRQGLDPLVAQEVVSGLLAIADTPEGLDALDRMLGIDALQPVDDSAYDTVRQMVDAFGLELETCSEVTTVDDGVDGQITYSDSAEFSSTLQVPGEAVTEATTLSFSPLPAVTFPPPAFAGTGVAFELRGLISGTQELVTVLQVPYTLTVSYDEAALDGVAESSLGLYYWTGQEWEQQPGCVVDAELNLVTCNPDHFSRWAVFGQYRVYLPLLLRNS